jgi:hypothetical protein
MLEAAGWVVQDYKAVNLYAGLGVAVRELVTEAGPATTFQGFEVPGAGRKFSELYNVQLLSHNHVDPVASVCIGTIQRAGCGRAEAAHPVEVEAGVAARGRLRSWRR